MPWSRLLSGAGSDEPHATSLSGCRTVCWCRPRSPKVNAREFLLQPEMVTVSLSGITLVG